MRYKRRVYTRLSPPEGEIDEMLMRMAAEYEELNAYAMDYIRTPSERWVLKKIRAFRRVFIAPWFDKPHGAPTHALFIILASGFCAFFIYASYCIIPRHEAVIALPVSPSPMVFSSRMPSDDVLQFLNTADVSVLSRVHGIGEKLAQSIIDEREKNGEYNFPEDVLYARGIGQSRLDSIRQYLSENQDLQ